MIPAKKEYPTTRQDEEPIRLHEDHEQAFDPNTLTVSSLAIPPAPQMLHSPV